MTPTPTVHRRRSDMKTINVTQQHIDEAIANCSNRCAVADAVKEAVPHAMRIRVDLQTIRWSDPVTKERYIYLTPARVQEYIIAFDVGDPVKPFQIRLNSTSRQVIPINEMPAEVQKALHKRRKSPQIKPTASNPMIVEKIGGKAPPGLSTVRGYGI